MYKTVNDVIEAINNAPIQGFEHHTPEFIAAEYAKNAAKEAGYGCDKAELEAHLNVIADADFNFDAALEIAQQ